MKPWEQYHARPAEPGELVVGEMRAAGVVATDHEARLRGETVKPRHFMVLRTEGGELVYVEPSSETRTITYAAVQRCGEPAERGSEGT